MRILILDDDAINQKMLSTMLQVYGRIDVASAGKEGLALFKEAFVSGEPYRIVCIDIMMPHMNGHEVLREIRRIENAASLNRLQRCRVIMTTSLSDPDNVMQAFNEECDKYLVKPISKQNLREALIQLGEIE